MNATQTGATLAELRRTLKTRSTRGLKRILKFLDRGTLEYVLSAPTDVGALMRAVAEYVVVIDAMLNAAPSERPDKKSARSGGKRRQRAATAPRRR